MKTFDQFITEGRDAPLYHGTRLTHAIDILRTGKILPNTLHHLRDYNQLHVIGIGTPDNAKTSRGISLTRSRAFAAHWVIKWAGQEVGVIFEFKQTLLAQRYKIKSTAFNQQFTRGKTDNITTRYVENKGIPANGGNEYEEFIITDKPLDIRKYVKRIIFIGNVTEALMFHTSIKPDWHDVIMPWEHLIYNYSYYTDTITTPFHLPEKLKYDSE
jgi:hypothetical protein